MADLAVAAGHTEGFAGEHAVAAEDIGGLADPVGHTQNIADHDRRSGSLGKLDHSSVVSNTVGRSIGLALHSSAAVAHHSRNRTAPVDHDPNYNHRSAAVDHNHSPVLDRLPGRPFPDSRLGNHSWCRLESHAATGSAQVAVALCKS